MECVKRYVSPRDYKSALCVNKEWNTLFSDKGAALLVHALKKGGWLDSWSFTYLKSVPIMQLVHVLIITLEESSNRSAVIPYKKPMTGITAIRIRRNPRLNYIDLMGI
jgi:hypothetical protein